MEKLKVVCLCIGLARLVPKCDCKQTAIQRLKDQLRVAKESHALDMRDVHEEIDSLKEKLEEIGRVVNGTDISRTNFMKAGDLFNTELLKKVLRNLDDFEVSKQNSEKSAELLKNGFNSFKAWNKQGINDLRESVLDIEGKLKQLSQKWMSGLLTLESKDLELNERLNEVKKNFTTSYEELNHQSSQKIQTSKNTCMLQLQRHENLVNAELNKVHEDIDKIRSKLPAYSIINEQWLIVFRVKSGIGIGVYDEWVKPLYTANLSAKGIYRNHVIDNPWNSLGMLFVRLALHDRKGKEVAFVLFDGVGSNKMTWFSRDRILDSSWGQLRYDSSLNYASIQGDGGRKFYINVRYGGCEHDHGFIFVLDRGHMACEYEQFSNHPQFLYSEFPGGTRWHSRYFGMADEMVISVKARNIL